MLLTKVRSALVGVMLSFIACGATAKPILSIPERFETTTCVSFAPIRKPFRVILIPDFDVLGGAHAFCQMLPHLLDLHPSEILINAEDVTANASDDEFKSVLRALLDKHLMTAAYYRAGKTVRDETSFRIGVVTHEPPEAAHSQTPGNLCIRWTTKPSANSLLGCALLKAGYKKRVCNNHADLVSAMPANFKNGQLIIVDVSIIPKRVTDAR